MFGNRKRDLDSSRHVHDTDYVNVIRSNMIDDFGKDALTLRGFGLR